MRVLLINTAEQVGGAAIAARRLLDALINQGIKAEMLVRDRQTRHPHVIALRHHWKQNWHFLWERVVIWAHNYFKRHNLFAVDIANTGNDITALPEFKQADVIHLHWVNQGMLSLTDIGKILRSGKKVVWTMHDMWTFTGICHYAGECNNYQKVCHHCPYLPGHGKKDLSYRIFRKKEKTWKKGQMTFVACSRWLEGLAKQSVLLREHQVCNIPNPINTTQFHPLNKKEARKRMGLPADRQLMLFGSLKVTDKRKGIDYLIEACRILHSTYPQLAANLGVVVIGKQSGSLADNLPFPTYALDYISDVSTIVDVYNAVDLYVTPSLEDNLPNTIMEAMACGVPCVCFEAGGMPEMVDHLHNGYVAEYRNAADFANGIHWVLTSDDYATLSDQAFHKVIDHYAESVIAKQYIDIYNKNN